jgi:hypothetical protein
MRPGQKCSTEQKAKISVALTGRHQLPETIAKRTGKMASRETRAAMSAAQIGKPKTRAHKQAIRVALIAKRSDPVYMSMKARVAMEIRNKFRKEQDKPYLSRSGQLYRMRSGWEIEFAVALDAVGLRWLYEPSRLLLSDGRTYIPDFYVEEWRQYVEIKGWSGWHSDKPTLAAKDGYPIRLISGRIALDEALATCQLFI